MENYEIAELLEETAKLLELHGENPFKIKSYQNAAFKIERLQDKLEGKSPEELATIDGIGKSLSHKIHVLLTENRLPDLDELISSTPEGVIEMMKLKGIGPKKVALLWKELQIESIGELLYACNENRLVELKGFGKKTQDTIRKAVEFRLAHRGYFHYATAEKSADEFLRKIAIKCPEITLYSTGEFRRKCEVLTRLNFLCNSQHQTALIALIQSLNDQEYGALVEEAEVIFSSTPNGIPIEIRFSGEDTFNRDRWLQTGNDLHIGQALAHNNKTTSDLLTCSTEEEIYTTLGLQFVEPEMREGLNEIEKAQKNSIAYPLIETPALKGILHNHSTYSDGIHSLEEMAKACRDAGYEYLGICDHSKSAQYAGGLSIERVIEQQEEIKQLNAAMAPFKIFSGIESDILADGSLDYPDEILQSFDFIVASVHSGLRMDKDKATTRLLKAIENPYTTILGHPTGRLLLSREGYPLDFEKILHACADHGVVVELNAHPYRLDLDWRWIDYAVNLGLQISINPDAHSTEGYADMYFGVCAARKGGLTIANTFNTKNLTEISDWFKKRKEK